MSLLPSLKIRSLNKILATISCLVFPFVVHAQTAILRLEELGDKGGFGQSQNDPRIIAGRIINGALGLVGVALLTLTIYAGFTWMTAGDNSDKIEEAKKTIRNCVIGLIIILLAFVISRYVISIIIGTPETAK